MLHGIMSIAPSLSSASVGALLTLQPSSSKNTRQMHMQHMKITINMPTVIIKTYFKLKSIENDDLLFDASSASQMEMKIKIHSAEHYIFGN